MMLIKQIHLGEKMLRQPSLGGDEDIEIAQVGRVARQLSTSRRKLLSDERPTIVGKLAQLQVGRKVWQKFASLNSRQATGTSS